MLFVGIWVLLGFFLHAYKTASAMPRRSLAGDDEESAAEGEAATNGTSNDSKNPESTEAAKPLPALTTETQSGQMSQDVMERMAQLEEIVQRLVTREGRDQGLLASKNGGRRASVSKSASLGTTDMEA